jgi:hypothetical protein
MAMSSPSPSTPRPQLLRLRRRKEREREKAWEVRRERERWGSEAREHECLVQLPSMEALIFFLFGIGTRERERNSSPHFHGNQQPYRDTVRDKNSILVLIFPILALFAASFFPALTKLKLRSISFIPTSQVSLIVFLECLHPLLT